MQRKTGKILVVLFVAAAVWLCVRLPNEIGGRLERLMGAGQVDPLKLHLSGEFVESNLGTAVEPDGSITVRLIAQQYNFVPACALVPVGVPVRFRITSADVVHRFAILGTDREIEVVPGHVSEAKLQFTGPGDHEAPCHEFCGPGHWDMRSRVRAVTAGEFPKLRPEERVTCAPR